MSLVKILDYIIKSIKIEDFWGSYNIQTEFNQDVNIFIGGNGTGKTTLMNILKAVLTVDLPLLSEQKFSNISIELLYKKKVRKIKVTRMEMKYPFEMLKYKIGNRVFEVPLSFGEYSHKRFHPMFIEKLTQLKSTIGEIVNVSWLSVHRELIPESETDEEYWVDKRPPVDRRLDELIGKFTSYQLKLENRAGICSNKFQRDVLTSTLYDEKLDHFDEPKKDLQFEKQKEGLVHAFEELGVPVDGAKIERHFREVQKSIGFLNQLKEGDRKLTIDEALPLSLLKRTQHIIKLSREAESDKRKIFQPRDKFLELLHNFIEKKEFVLGSGGQLLVKIRDTDRELKIAHLSSGEKQLLILLTETLLQENRPFIFIADEPELSLHIEWQERLLGAIRSLNKNAQLIMATHSPEIVSEFGNSTFNMESVFIE